MYRPAPTTIAGRSLWTTTSTRPTSTTLYGRCAPAAIRAIRSTSFMAVGVRRWTLCATIPNPTGATRAWSSMPVSHSGARRRFRPLHDRAKRSTSVFAKNGRRIYRTDSNFGRRASWRPCSLGRSVGVLLDLDVHECDGGVGLFQHAPALQPIGGASKFPVWNRSRIRHDDAAFPQIRDLELGNVTLPSVYVEIDKVMHVSRLVRVDPPDSPLHRTIEGRVRVGIDSI